jgi:GNAT superfamily N-acetyltransferase
MTAVNAAVEIDLTGQICADSIGHHYYSGIGGQVDFIRGAARSRKGKPVIVLRSTACRGTVSRIVAQLREGAGVVTTRGDVHYVVTEYGVADLWGKSVRERALALITVAHPKFRAELLEEAKRRRLLFEDQPLPPPTYPEGLEYEESFAGGARLHFRPIRPTDEPLMKDLFYACSADTIYHRFFSAVKAMPHSKLQDFVNVDGDTRVCLVGVAADGEAERIVAVGRYTHDRSTGLADVAFLVRDDFQGRGVGTSLLRHLAKIASARGILGFTADVLADNRAMLHVFHKSGCKIESSLSAGVYHLEFRFDPERRDGRALPAASDPPSAPATKPVPLGSS